MEIGLEEIRRRLDVLEKAVFNGKFISAEVHRIQFENVGHIIRDIHADLATITSDIKKMATKTELDDLRNVLRWGFRWLVGALTMLTISVIVAFITRSF